MSIWKPTRKYCAAIARPLFIGRIGLKDEVLAAIQMTASRINSRNASVFRESGRSPSSKTGKKRIAIGFLVVLFLTSPGMAWSLEPKNIGELVQAFKKDERGPYQAIRWFCPDGAVLPANQRCPQPGGIQHAIPKEVVQKLAEEQGIFLGQILAGTPFMIFLDPSNGHSRMKQYQVEKYLQSIDDGWIMRRARYYRGAIQAENEENWGQDFLK